MHYDSGHRVGIQEFDAYLHPHGHLYDLKALADEYDKLVRTGTVPSTIDIDALAKKHLADKPRTPSPSDRFTLKYSATRRVPYPYV